VVSPSSGVGLSMIKGSWFFFKQVAFVLILFAQYWLFPGTESIVISIAEFKL